MADQKSDTKQDCEEITDAFKQKYNVLLPSLEALVDWVREHLQEIMDRPGAFEDTDHRNNFVFWADNVVNQKKRWLTNPVLFYRQLLLLRQNFWSEATDSLNRDNVMIAQNAVAYQARVVPSIWRKSITMKMGNLWTEEELDELHVILNDHEFYTTHAKVVWDKLCDFIESACHYVTDEVLLANTENL